MKRGVTSLFLLLWLCTVPSACLESESPARSGSDMTGTRQERVDAFTARLAKRIQPPGRVLDAQCREEQIGDGVLGPSDFIFYCAFSVPPAEVDAWTRLLTQAGAPVHYAAPRTAPGWWLSREEFEAAEHYEPGVLGFTMHGWVAVSAESGRIYICNNTT
jgi:hypothetical protein